MQLAYLAFSKREEPYTDKAQTFQQSCDVLLIARQASSCETTSRGRPSQRRLARN